MGSIIREDTEGEPSAVLTETGKGGLFSQGYLRDAPAREYVGKGETAVFVLTDDETGVERTTDGDAEAIQPGKGYRAITNVTDRRVIILVGNAEDGGDKRVTLPLVEITTARADSGAFVVEMRSGVTWRCHADASGVEEVAEYTAAAAEAWRDVESTLDAVKRSIVAATAHRDEGEYDAALDEMREARDDIEAVQKRAAEFREEWPGDAMADRVEQVRDRCLTTAAEVRVGYARTKHDEGEEFWRDGRYEQARDAFEAAREAYDAVQSLSDRHRTAIDDVERALARVERSIERLDHAPLRNAIDADRRAREAEPSLETLDALAEARERYEIVLELDPGADERRFAGDRDRIREQREDVTDRFVETALSIGTDALEAGEWYCETGQADLAVDELERAVTALERGHDVASTERPADADELRQKRAAARDTLQTTCEEHGLDGSDDVRGGDRIGRNWGAEETNDGGDHGIPANGDPADATATDGGLATESGAAGALASADDEASANEAADAEALDHAMSAPDSAPLNEPQDGGHQPESNRMERGSEETPSGRANSPEGEVETESVEAVLRDLRPAEFERVVSTVVEAMGWRPEPTASTACDFLAKRDDPSSGNLAIRTFRDEDGEPIEPETVRDCASLAASVPSVEGVVIVTTRPLTDAAMAAARSQEVRVLDVEYLAATLGGQDADDARSVLPDADR